MIQGLVNGKKGQTGDCTDQQSQDRNWDGFQRELVGRSPGRQVGPLRRRPTVGKQRYSCSEGKHALKRRKGQFRLKIQPQI